MKELKTEIDIQASPEKVWSILTDFTSYPDWNPFVTSLKGDIKPGSQFEVTLRTDNSKPMVFKPKCLIMEPNKQFKWLGKLGVKGIFDGAHNFELVDKGNGVTTLIQSEEFSGLLVGMLWSRLNTSTRKGFERMNEAVKIRSEAN